MVYELEGVLVVFLVRASIRMMSSVVLELLFESSLVVLKLLSKAQDRGVQLPPNLCVIGH